MLTLRLSDSEAFALLLAIEGFVIEHSIQDPSIAEALERPAAALYAHGVAAPYKTAAEARYRRS